MTAWSFWSVIGIVFTGDAMHIAARLWRPSKYPDTWADAVGWGVVGFICLIVGAIREQKKLAKLLEDK